MSEVALRAPDTTLDEIEKAAHLEPGTIQRLGLRLTNPEMDFDDWQRLGVGLGNLHRWSIWALGDWLLFGEQIYGEDAYQAVEGNVFDRYNLASRVTGLREETLRNYASLAGRVAQPRRRAELYPTTHIAVAPLEPEQQSEWLQKAVDNGWGREQLARAVKGKDPDPPTRPGISVSGPPRLSPEDQLKAAARNVWGLASETGDGAYLVPGEPMAQLRAALDEDEE